MAVNLQGQEMEGCELKVVGLSVKLTKGGVVTVDLDCHLDSILESPGKWAPGYDFEEFSRLG